MKLHLSPLTLLFFSIYLLVAHDLTLVATISAIVIHELTHLIVLLLCNGRAARLSITPLGLSIEREGLLSHWNEVWLSISAPLMNLVLSGLFLAGHVSMYAVYANLSFGLFNLLPIYPLDGAKALFAALSRWRSPDQAGGICRVISLLTLFLLWLFSIAFALFYDGNLSLLLLCSVMFISNASDDAFYK